MKMKLLALAAICLLMSCTENQRAKSWGGSTTVDLPPNTKLVNVTWKETQIWYLTRPMTEGEVAVSSDFCEKSSYGVVEGKVTFKETKK